MADENNNIQGTQGHEEEVINVSGLKASLQKYKDKERFVHQMNSAPTSSTTTYTIGTGASAKTYDFKIGDEVRVYDAESGDEETNNYVYYKLYDLVTTGNVTTAYWALAGAGGGGGGGATGKIRVNLEAYSNGSKTAGADLTGLEVTVTNTTDSTIVETKEWAGETLVFKNIVPLKAYSISVEAVEGYATPSAQTISEMGIGDDVTKTFMYNTDEYTVSITSNQGTDDAIASAWLRATYTYDGETVNKQVSSGTVKVPTGVTPTISASSNITDYSKTSEVDSVNKVLSVVYSTTKVYLTAASNQGSSVVSSLSFEVNGSAITQNDNTSYVKVATGGTITVTAPSVTNYAKAVTGDGTATGTTQTVNVQYDATRVNLNMVGSVSGVEGAFPTGASGTVSYSGGTDQVLSDNSSEAYVPTGTAFTITYSAVSNYGTPQTYSATAAGVSMTADKATYIYGVLQLTVAMSDSDSTALASVAPEISINGGTPIAMTGSGGVFSHGMDVGDTYEITFNSLVGIGYQTPAAVTGTFGGGMEQKSATYQTTVYTLASITTTKDGSVQGSNPQGVGATLTYTGQTSAATLSAVNDTAKVPSNLTPTITPNTVYGYAASASESNASIALTYATTAYHLTVATNQSAHTDIASTVIRVSATGISANGYIDYTGAQNSTEVLVPAGATVTAASQSGAPSANTYAESITVDGTNHTVNALYSTEVLTISITKDSSLTDLDLTTLSVAVTNGQTALGTLTNASPTLKVAYGINYTLTPSIVQDGSAVADAITKDWADTTSKSVTIQYVPGDFVDLGLPSGILWAVGNITKDTNGNYSMAAPNEYGAFFSWGNIDGHNVDGQSEEYNFSSANYQNTPGYSLTGDIPTNATYDAARARLGGNWRIPTESEFTELLNNCTWNWKAAGNTDYNGIAGYEVVGTNGNKIFLPCAGYWDENIHYTINTRGRYQSTRYSSTANFVGLNFNNSTCSTGTLTRSSGHSIRACQLPHQDITIILNPTDGTSASGISVTVTDSEGATHTGITDSNGQVALQGVANGSATVSITDYIVSPNTITISNSTKSFTCNCSYAPLGVWAYYSDGTLKSESEADSSAIGVAVITNNCRFVIDKLATNSDSGIYYGGYNKDLSSIGVVVTSDAATAKLDFDGEGNTTKLINALDGYNDGYVTGAAAALACRSAFSGQGYMASLGEWNEAYANKVSVDSMMTKIGGTAINTSYHWSSTLYNASLTSWELYWINGNASYGNRSTNHRVRAFRAL